MPKAILSARMVAEPSSQTLDKYGLTPESWATIVRRQGGVCAICGTLPKTCRLVIDHEHVKGWKKMSAFDRSRYVRGLLCWVCNHYYCGRGITIEKARGLVRYLKGYANVQK